MDGAPTSDRTLAGVVHLATSRSFADLPDATVHQARRVLLDSLGCLYGAWTSDAPLIARRLARASSPTGPCSILGSSRSTSPELAAFANGAAIRCLDYNDTVVYQGGAGHPSDYIPAVIAVAELVSANGADVILGMAVVYEVFAWLTEVLDAGRGALDHVTIGAVASAAGAAAVLGLTVDKTAEAISLALVANVALHAARLGRVSAWKSCAAADAARNGVFAALAAGHGLTGPARPFDGDGGLGELLGKQLGDDAPAPEHRGAILETHLKLHPAGFFSQTPIEAALEARRGNENRAIDSVRLGTSATAIRFMAGDREKWHPTSRETADHSLPYLLAVALARGAIAADDFEPAAFESPELRALTAKIIVELDDDCSAHWPADFRAHLDVRFTDGGTANASVVHHRGHARNPMSDAEIEDKFRAQAKSILTPDAQQRLVETVWMLGPAVPVDRLVDATRAAMPADHDDHQEVTGLERR